MPVIKILYKSLDEASDKIFKQKKDINHTDKAGDKNL